MEMKNTKITAMLYPQPGNPRNSEGSFLRLDDGRIAMRFLAQNENIGIIIPGMASVAELEQNVASYANKEPLTEAEQEFVRRNPHKFRPRETESDRQEKARLEALLA